MKPAHRIGHGTRTERRDEDLVARVRAERERRAKLANVEEVRQ